MQTNIKSKFTDLSILHTDLSWRVRVRVRVKGQCVKVCRLEHHICRLATTKKQMRTSIIMCDDVPRGHVLDGDI